MSALPDVLSDLERQKAEAQSMEAQAPVAKVLEHVIDQLRAVDGVPDMDRRVNTREAGSILGLAPETVAIRCGQGHYPGAEKTSECGEWRIPLRAIYRAGKGRAATVQRLADYR